MAHLDNDVCSLNLAIRLKKLGVQQDSLFYYVWFPDTEEYGCCFRVNGFWVENHSGHSWKEDINNRDISAFTTGELGGLLPKASNWSSGIDAAGVPDKYEPYEQFFCKSYTYDCVSGKEANARAKQLIFLLENKL